MPFPTWRAPAWPTRGCRGENSTTCLCSLVSLSLNDISAVLQKELETQGIWVTDFAVHLSVHVPNSQQHQISIPIWKQPCQGIRKVHLLNTWTSGRSLSRGIGARAQSDSVTSLSRWKDKKWSENMISARLAVLPGGLVWEWSWRSVPRSQHCLG